MTVDFRDDQYIPVQGMYASTWRGDPARAGRGALLEHSIHDVDVLEWLFGPMLGRRHDGASSTAMAGIDDATSPGWSSPRRAGHNYHRVARDAGAAEHAPRRGAVRAAARRGRG